jgi:hypothetical protein
MHVYQSRVYTHIDSFHTHTLPVSHTFQTSLSSSMPPDSDNIDLVNPLTFKKEEWIGKKHTYSPALPFYVIKACDKALEIPKHEISRIPPPSLTIGDLMQKVIPRVESSWPLYKAETWFSRHISIRNGDLPCFGQRGTPCAQREMFLGFFWDFFVLCGRVRTNTPTFWDPPQNPDKTAPNWQIFVRTKLATCLANITLYNPGSC